jgi:hypothetical protein
MDSRTSCVCQERVSTCVKPSSLPPWTRCWPATISLEAREQREAGSFRGLANFATARTKSKDQSPRLLHTTSLRRKQRVVWPCKCSNPSRSACVHRTTVLSTLLGCRWKRWKLPCGHFTARRAWRTWPVNDRG